MGLHARQPLSRHDLHRRHRQHRCASGATPSPRWFEIRQQYRLRRLVHVERHDTMALAIAREKAVKKWLRDWKIELIERANSNWVDLFETINA